MNKLIIIGASGHGKVVADIAVLNGYRDIIFLDDNESIKECVGWPVIGKTDSKIEGDIFVAIGNASVRKKLSEGRKLVTLIHPDAVIADGVKIGKGSVIMAGVIINPGTIIGEGCIINTASSIDHDCVIGDYVHVAVAAHLCGTVNVGNYVWCGAGSIISNNVNICDSCTIGAGAVVIRNIIEPSKYIGLPAKKLRN